MSQPTDSDPREFVHCIDDDGLISFVNDAWLAFAAENEWIVAASQVVGSPLMRQIADSRTQHIYQLIIDRARVEGRGARFLYRCDSPDCRRFMEMRIRRTCSGEVEFRSRVLRVERRDSANVLAPPLGQRSGDTLTMCSWCKAVQVNEDWVEVEQAVRRLGILAERAPPRISHGICPTCCEHMTRVTGSR